MTDQSEIAKRLAAAVNGDRRYWPREHTYFAIRPVWGWCPEEGTMAWLYLRRVRVLNVLGLGPEYFGISNQKTVTQETTK